MMLLFSVCSYIEQQWLPSFAVGVLVKMNDELLLVAVTVRFYLLSYTVSRKAELEDNPVHFVQHAKDPTDLALIRRLLALLFQNLLHRLTRINTWETCSAFCP